MRGREDIFLSIADAEKMRLFRRIVNARVAETPVADRLATERANKPLVTDVNLRQIAALTGRNYGSVYNTYNGLVAELEQLTHHKNATVRRLFDVPSSELRYFLIAQGHPYHFLEALLTHRYQNFDEFLAAEDTSKATMLRHLKPLRDFAHEFGVRFSYETLHLQGEEKRLRVFLTISFWLATDGAEWPFAERPREQVSALIDQTVRLFDMGKPNLVTREIAMYYAGVCSYRVRDGATIPYSEDAFTLKYPVPNFLEELSPDMKATLGIGELDLPTQMGESAGLYFLFNFMPFYVTTGDDMQATIVQRFRRYNPEIYTLVHEFMTKLPVSFITDQLLPKQTMNMLMANLLAVTLSTLEFGEDLTEVIAYTINDRLHQMPDNQSLQKKVRQTLEHVIFSQKLTVFEDKLNVLSASYYRNVLQLVIQFLPPVKVKVAIVIEQTLLGYVDLISFLITQPLVEVVSPNETPLADADLVIESSTVPDAAAKKGSKPITYKWAANSSNDWFGELYATIRQIWDDKMRVGGEVDY